MAKGLSGYSVLRGCGRDEARRKRDGASGKRIGKGRPKRLAEVLCVLLLAGCGREEPPLPAAGRSTVAVTTEIPSRSLLDGLRVVWSPDDRIALFDGTPSAKLFTLEEGARTPMGVFGGPSLAASERYVALYPYDDRASIEGSTLRLVLPATQPYAPASFGAGANPAVAVGERTDFAMGNLCGVLRIELTGTALVRSLALRGGSGEVLCGGASVDLRTAMLRTPVLGWLQDTGTVIRLLCADPVALSPDMPTPFHFVVPPGTYRGLVVEVCDADQGSMAQHTLRPITVHRSAIRPMAPFAYRAVHTSLDTAGSASCYRIEWPGHYDFAARPGNGVAQDGTALPPLTEEGKTYAADWVWASRAGWVDEVRYAEGRILFHASGQPGSALIALYETDAQGTVGPIVWSWHIWCSPAGELDLREAGRWLDRNLGATRNTPGAESYGLYYQFGRRDPIVGVAAAGGPGYPDEWYPTETVAFAEGTTPPTAVTRPTVSNEARFGSTMAWSFSKMLYPSLSQIGRYPMTFSLSGKHLWTNSDCTYAWRASTGRKTACDPCPPGYRVPTVAEAAAFVQRVIDPALTVVVPDEGASPTAGRTYRSGEANFWLPAAGLRRDSDGRAAMTGGGGCYWLADPAASTPAERAPTLGFASGEPSVQAAYQASGAPVRCIRDTEQ